MRKLEYPGLCGTCLHAIDCMYRINSQKEIYQCEEFTTYEKQNIDPVTIEFADNNTDPYKGYKGLCMNCEMKKTCTVAKSDSIIWHCEEYC